MSEEPMPTAIVTVKRFSRAKSRLMDAGALTKPERAALLKAMLTDTLRTLQAAGCIERTVLVTGEGRAERLAMDLIRRSPKKERRPLEVMQEPEDLGHSGAATVGIVRALSLGAPSVILLPGDAPLVTVAELEAIRDALHVETDASGRVVVVPDRAGTGTNALAMTPADAIGPAFGPDSRAAHLRKAADRGMEATVLDLPGLAHDLDTPEDLALLAEKLAEDPGLAPETAAVVPTLAGA